MRFERGDVQSSRDDALRSIYVPSVLIFGRRRA
jgi:hypothetical protein